MERSSLFRELEYVMKCLHIPKFYTCIERSPLIPAYLMVLFRNIIYTVYVTSLTSLLVTTSPHTLSDLDFAIIKNILTELPESLKSTFLLLNSMNYVRSQLSFALHL